MASYVASQLFLAAFEGGAIGTTLPTEQAVSGCVAGIAAPQAPETFMTALITYYSMSMTEATTADLQNLLISLGLKEDEGIITGPTDPGCGCNHAFTGRPEVLAQSMNDNKVAAQEQLNVELQEAVTTGQIVVQVTDDSDPPQPIEGAQVTVIDGTIVTGTTNADGEVTLDVSFDDMKFFATKEVAVTVVTPPDGYTLSERSAQKVTTIALATIDVNLVLKPSSPGSRTLQVVPVGPGSGTVSSTGISCGEDCTEVYRNGPQVTLTATPLPATDSVFSGWSGGDCSGTVPCTVTMNQDRTIIANFGLTSYTLQTVLAGPGSGTVNSDPEGISCGEDCSEVYANGTQVTLTATPATGSVFSGWRGGGRGPRHCRVAGRESVRVAGHSGRRAARGTGPGCGAGP